MFLRDLSIQPSDHAKIPQGHTMAEFFVSAHAIQEIFLTFMPRKYLLDGMAKANVAMGPSGGEPQYQQLINVNMYFVEDFDFRAYFGASVQQRDEMLLSALESALLDIASRNSADQEPIRGAIAAARACGGERRYVISRMSRLTKSRKLKLNVVRHIVHGGESWGIDISNRKGQVLDTLWIAKNTDFLQAAYNFKRSILKGENFVVLDWLGRQSYKLNVTKLENKLIGAAGGS